MATQRKFTFKFPNLAYGEMPILGYVEPQMYRDDANKGFDVSVGEAFDDLQASGINTLLDVNYFMNEGDDETVAKIMDECALRHMNFLFKDRLAIVDRTPEEAAAYFKKTYERFAHNPAFAGLHVIDEPGYVDWEKFGRLKEGFKKAWPDKLFYINLLQVYAPHWAFSNGAVYDFEKGGGLPDDPDYHKYYQSYIDVAKPEIFSYDHYPCEGEFPALRGDYFEQLSLAHNYAKKGGVPIFSFVQVCTFGNQSRLVSEGELKWQVNTALAYGSKGIAYFCYWNPFDLPHWRQAMIDVKGNKSVQYYRIQRINTYIRAVDEYLMNSDFVGYMNFGETPNGEKLQECDRIEKFGKLAYAEGGNFFVGCFERETGEKVYYVVNNSITSSASLQLHFNERVEATLVCRDLSFKLKNDTFKLELGVGDAVLVVTR